MTCDCVHYYCLPLFEIIIIHYHHFHVSTYTRISTCIYTLVYQPRTHTVIRPHPDVYYSIEVLSHLDYLLFLVLRGLSSGSYPRVASRSPRLPWHDFIPSTMRMIRIGVPAVITRRGHMPRFPKGSTH
jgi:hypothetical protein